MKRTTKTEFKADIYTKRLRSCRLQHKNQKTRNLKDLEPSFRKIVDEGPNNQEQFIETTNYKGQQKKQNSKKKNPNLCNKKKSGQNSKIKFKNGKNESMENKQINVGRINSPAKKKKTQTPGEVIKEIKQKLKLIFEESKDSKYFSKKIYTKIMEGNNFPILNLKQDQKKSLQCNLLYNILRELNWMQIYNYIKKFRNKLKALKVSTFKEYILNGKLFQKEKDNKKYEVTSAMMQAAVAKLQDEDYLYQRLLEKKFYENVFEENVELYKEKMIVLVYKIMQFSDLMIREFRQNYYSDSLMIDIEQILNNKQVYQKQASSGSQSSTKGEAISKQNVFQSYINANYEQDFERGSVILSCCSLFIDEEEIMKDDEKQEVMEGPICKRYMCK